MNCYFYSIIALFFVLPLNAQEETPCVEITDSKVLKLFEKAKNSKKYNYKERVAYFKEAIELDEQQCIKCMWELAKLTYRRASSKGDKMDIPKKYFREDEFEVLVNECGLVVENRIRNIKLYQWYVLFFNNPKYQFIYTLKKV